MPSPQVRPWGSDATARLDALYDAIRDSNPFAANRVNEPSPYDVDVPTIHANSFDRLVALADQARRQRRGIGVALLGGAGVGKSHLLSRLYRWANAEVDQGRKRACYVYLHNLLADPDRLPRYLLKCVVHLLAEGGRGPLHETELIRLIDGAIWHALKSKNPGVRSASLKEGEAAYQALFGRSPGAREVYGLLFQLFRHAHPRKAADPRARSLARAALAWLAGEEIEAESARALGLPADGRESVLLRDDHEVEQVLLALAQLARLRDQPFIICIDQVDNLDPDKLQALTRFLHALLDHAANLLVIISGVKQTLLNFKENQIIAEAVWDRVAEYRVELLRIRREEVRQILEARLERFFEPFEELEPVHQHLQRDTLFPLGRAWLAGRLVEGQEFRARDILIWARDAWEDEQAKLAELGLESWLGGWPIGQSAHENGPREGDRNLPITLEAAIDALVERKLEEHIAQRRLHPGSLPPDAGNLAGLVQALLEQCRGADRPYTLRDVRRMEKRNGRLPPYDLLVRERREPDGQEITSGVLFLSNTGRSASEALKRLLNDEPPPDHRLLVTDEERRPLQVGSTGQEYYRDLGRLGPHRFEHLKIGFEQYAALDALEGVVRLARVGDLEVEHPRGTIRQVTEAEVIASHHRQDRYRRHPLLRPLLTEEPPPGEPEPPPVALDEADVRQHTMAQLAWRLGMTAHEVTNGYLKAHPTLALPFEAVRARIKAIAARMHAEGLIYATPTDDDLFLQRRA
ncbi:MAG: hypothetical protein IRY99_11915 [Isosphaeraceae bacterium]|nr:hypothetical protein [Isosphaeraceae bacterium]